MRADIVEACSPRISSGAVPRPLLVFFLVEHMRRELNNCFTALERQRREKIRHVDLVVGIRRRDNAEERVGKICRPVHPWNCRVHPTL